MYQSQFTSFTKQHFGTSLAPVTSQPAKSGLVMNLKKGEIVTINKTCKQKVAIVHSTVPQGKRLLRFGKRVIPGRKCRGSKKG